MNEPTVIKLDSGATLKIQVAPFADAKALYQAILKEFRKVPFSSQIEMQSLWKNLLCVGFSSPEIDFHLAKCMERCTINDLKIDRDTFEPVELRGDYLKVCVEVAKANTLPFAKSLYASYTEALSMIGKDPA